ncbi:MAG: aryl-sulfate sulfotransferase, partial [Bacteroidota bacterium]
AVTKQSSGSSLDFIIEYDTQTRSITEEWDMRQYLDVDRKDLVFFAGTDWLHVNSIWHDASDNSLVVSGRNQGIVKVGYDKELKWIMAPHRGWENAGINGNGFDTKDFLLTAVDQEGNILNPNVQEGIEQAPDFDWTWGQHAAMVFPDGDIFVFDNGFNRNFRFQTDGYSRAAKFSVDGTSLQVKQTWEYGKLLGAEFWSNIISDVDYLPIQENVLITAGTNRIGSSIREISYPNKETIFSADLIYKNEFSDGTVWGDFDIMYRSERMPLY